MHRTSERPADAVVSSLRVTPPNIRMEPTRLASCGPKAPWRAAHSEALGGHVNNRQDTFDNQLAADAQINE